MQYDLNGTTSRIIMRFLFGSLDFAPKAIIYSGLGSSCQNCHSHGLSASEASKLI